MTSKYHFCGEDFPPQEFNFSFIKLIPVPNSGWWSAVLDIPTVRFNRPHITVIKQTKGADPRQAVELLRELLIREIRENQAALEFFEKNITVV